MTSAKNNIHLNAMMQIFQAEHCNVTRPVFTNVRVADWQVNVMVYITELKSSNPKPKSDDQPRRKNYITDIFLDRIQKKFSPPPVSIYLGTHLL